MEKRGILNKLKEEGFLTKSGDIQFNFFKPFKINKVYFETRNFEDILILESEGKRFEYWISQDLFIPPWQTHWFQLKDNFLFKLKEDLLRDLILESGKKAGNTKRLCEQLKMSFPSFYNFINKKGIEMISVLKLRKILNYLGRGYNFIDNKIEYTKKGNQISIKNPNFPISLDVPFGAFLLGMVVSDGCIYVDKKARNCIRTKYSSGEKESTDKFIKIINKVYGKTFIQKEYIRNCEILKIGSSIIGDSLVKVGAIIGHKAENDGGVPWMIIKGSLELKRNYLQAVFEDEASIYSGKSGYIVLTRYKHLKDLKKSHKKELRKLEKFMICNKFPTGHENKRITIRRAIEKIKLDDLKDFLLNGASKLLVGESKLLEEFGINNRLWPMALNKTSLGKYSISYTLFISRKKSILKFYKEIGFSLNDKEKKLLKLMKLNKWR